MGELLARDLSELDTAVLMIDVTRSASASPERSPIPTRPRVSPSPCRRRGSR
jgi:hypothetical protein